MIDADIILAFVNQPAFDSRGMSRFSGELEFNLSGTGLQFDWSKTEDLRGEIIHDYTKTIDSLHAFCPCGSYCFLPKIYLEIPNASYQRKYFTFFIFQNIKIIF